MLKKSRLDITTSGSGKNRDKLMNQDYFIALLTTNYCLDDKCVGELRDAKAMGLPLFGLIKYGEYIPKWIVNLPWKKLIYFHDKNMESASNELFEEIKKAEQHC